VACAVAVLPAFAGRATSAPTRKISAWIPQWDQTRAYNSFLANADLYDEALPYWYEMKSPTSVMAYAGAEDPTVTNGIKSKGVRLTPTIANAFDGSRVSSMLSTSSGRTAHVNTLVNLVTSKGFDGIDVDYENMLAGDRANFTSFITQLASALHAKAKKLDVAVYAKTAEPGTWDGPKSEDYAALGKVVDRLQLMTYDYHWNTSAAGAIAPLSWVDQVAAFAATAVTPSKVELGMHLYGYDWVGTKGETQMWDVMESRRTTNAATKRWDATSAESWFTYSAGGQSHTVWYGDSKSVSARLAIVDKYNLAGAAFWRLGGEDPAVWPVVRNRWSVSTTTTSTTRPPATTSTTVKPTTTTSTTVKPATATVKPSAPQNLHVTSTTGGVTLAWSAPATGPVDHYVVCRGSWAAETCMWTTTATTFADTSAAMWAFNYYRVAAVNAAGQGAYTADVGSSRSA
jgi:spore germination protein YaaH